MSRAKSKVETALNARGIRFIGGYRTRVGRVRGIYYRGDEGYGKQEAARRLKRMQG